MQSAPTLKERIGSLLGDSTTADVTFVVGEVRERFPAHSQVMSTASDSLRAMLFGDFNRESVVEVLDVAQVGFRVMLWYIYMDEADITEDNPESVVKVSDKCWELVVSHGNDALNSEAFLGLTKDVVAKILASDLLAVDETVFYDRAIDWAKRQLET